RELPFLFAGKLAGRKTGPVAAASRTAAEVVWQHNRSGAVFQHQTLRARGNAEAGIIRETGPVAAEIVGVDARHAVAYVGKKRWTQNDCIAQLPVKISVVRHRWSIVKWRFAKRARL